MDGRRDRIRGLTIRAVGTGGMVCSEVRICCEVHDEVAPGRSGVCWCGWGLR